MLVTSGVTYLDPTDVSYSLSIGSLSRLIQKIFNDGILVIEPETQHWTCAKNILIFALGKWKDFTEYDKFVTLQVLKKPETLIQYVRSLSRESVLPPMSTLAANLAWTTSRKSTLTFPFHRQQWGV